MTAQPPEGLGYEVDGHDRYFYRWGAYHCLSTRSDRRENLHVFNTHSMGTALLAEIYMRTKDSEVGDYVVKGINAANVLFSRAQADDGYYRYSMYWVEKSPDQPQEWTLGYHAATMMFALLTLRYIWDEALANSLRKV